MSATRWLRTLVAALRPEPGTTEGALYVGLALVAAGFIAAGAVPLALLVPGAVVTLIAAVPALRRP